MVNNYVLAKISIDQNFDSILLMEAIFKFIGFGRLSKPHISKTKVRVVDISKIDDIIILINKLENHKLHGAKYLDYLNFCKSIKILKNKEHLTINN